MSKSKFRKELDVPAVQSDYKGTEKLKGKTAIITGGDSGIGRSVAVHFAREGANTVVLEDAKETKALIEAEGTRCILLKGDLAKEAFCKKIIISTLDQLGTIDILVNNAGMHVEDKHVEGDRVTG